MASAAIWDRLEGSQMTWVEKCYIVELTIDCALEWRLQKRC